MSNWEIGLKSELWSRRLRLNVTAFQMDYKDIQFEFPNPAAQTGEIENARETVKIRGIEADLAIAPARGLTLTTSYSYLDTKPMVLTNPYTTLFVSQPFLVAPRHSGSGAVDYSFEVAGLQILAHVDAVYSSSYYTSIADPTKNSSYFLVNGRITMDDIIPVGTGGLSLSFWGKNIFGKTYAVNEFLMSGLGLSSITSSYYNEPATYGVEARVRF